MSDLYTVKGKHLYLYHMEIWQGCNNKHEYDSHLIKIATLCTQRQSSVAAFKITPAPCCFLQFVETLTHGVKINMQHKSISVNKHSPVIENRGEARVILQVL